MHRHYQLNLSKTNRSRSLKIEESTPVCGKGKKKPQYIVKNIVHVKMTSIRSHFNPDNIEGIRVGDVVYFHVTNLEQDWDVPHGFAIRVLRTELLIMPGETLTLKWVPKTIWCISHVLY